MKEYKVEFAFGIRDLMEKVNAAIAEGWQPLGGVCVSHLHFGEMPSDNTWVQAMVR
jgi:hypothetical protein